MHSATEGRADDDGNGPVAVGAISRARGLADDLIEGGVDEVRELDLRDRYETVEGRADRNADDARLGKRHIEDACLAELCVQPVRGAEDTAFAPDVLAHDEHALVALHLLGDGRAHSLDHPHLSHPLYPSTTHCPPPQRWCSRTRARPVRPRLHPGRLRPSARGASGRSGPGLPAPRAPRAAASHLQAPSTLARRPPHESM